MRAHGRFKNRLTCDDDQHERLQRGLHTVFTLLLKVILITDDRVRELLPVVLDGLITPMEITTLAVLYVWLCAHQDRQVLHLVISRASRIEDLLMKLLDVFERARAVMLLEFFIIIVVAILFSSLMLKLLDALRPIVTLGADPFLNEHHLRGVHTTVETRQTVVALYVLKCR